MVKYLAEFSRDYSQHIYLWKIKELRKEEENMQSCGSGQSGTNWGNVQSVIYAANSSVYHGAASYPSLSHHNPSSTSTQPKQPQSFRNSIHLQPNPNPSLLNPNDPPLPPQSSQPLKKSTQQLEPQIQLKKLQFQKLYGIMQILPLPNSVYFDKNKINIDVMKLRMNQLYRDAKYRNNFVKNQILAYSNIYQAKFIDNHQSSSSLNTRQNLLQDTNPHISHPYRVSLLIQKNGFSCINITNITQEDRYYSPMKEKSRLSSLSTSNKEVGYGLNSSHGGVGGNTGGIAQVGIKTSKTEFVINSLKVLRVSENFLPPLHHARKQTTRLNTNSNSNQTNQQPQKNQPNPSNFSSFNPNHNYNSHHPHNNPENMMKLQLESGQIQPFSSNGVIYYNQQLLRQAQRRKNQKKRIIELRKHFTSEEKKKKKNDPEEKISEWLDKINIMKQLERKKILGLG